MYPNPIRCMSSLATTQERIDIIVIGAKKAGSNWMQLVLVNHPQVIIPSFERVYIYGPQSDENSAKSYSNCILHDAQRLAHIKGDYFVTPAAIDDILAASSRKQCKIGRRILLILCCRHPVDRLYSDYAYDLRNGQTTRNFENWLNSPRGQIAVTLSSYGKAIEKWWDPLLLPCLICFTEEYGKFEQLQTLATFLQISPFAMPPANTRPNSSKLPRQRHINRWLAHVERFAFLPRKLQHLLHRSREKLFVIDKRLPLMNVSTRARLEAMFEPDIRKFETITGLRTPWLP